MVLASEAKEVREATLVEEGEVVPRSGYATKGDATMSKTCREALTRTSRAMRLAGQAGVVTLIVLVVAPLRGYAQGSMPEVRSMIFGALEDSLEKAKAEQADLLSPTFFGKADENYAQALQDFRRGKELKDIHKKVKEAQAALREAMRVSQLGRVTFPNLLRAREDALKANAPQYALPTYEEAERRFTDAAKALEGGDVKSATQKGTEAERKFREAELQAIKSSVMGTVQQLIAQGEEQEASKFAPKTYGRAKALLVEAESILSSDRYAGESAQEKVEQAEYEARHAVYLTKLIKKLRADERGWEDFILGHEVLLTKIAQEVAYQPQYDSGIAQPVESMLLAIQNLKQENRRLSGEVSDLNMQISKLSEELSGLREELDKMREKEAGLQAKLEEEKAKLEAQKRKEEKFKKVEALFSPEEAVVLRQGDDLVIRLKGLTFPPGKATIDPKFFAFLTKVQRTIREFPNCTVTVEGHTDAIGDARYNESLSLIRANAVRQYLIANMGLHEDRVTAVGYGESRPIASNDTEAGRMQNRRIDIVLGVQGVIF